MAYPDHLRYTDSHEYVQLEGDIATIGITFFAQDELGEVVFVELPEVGDSFTKGDQFGTVESTKAVSELYAPLSGEVVEVNSELEDQPELINASPYDEAWIIKLKVSDDGELTETMTAAEYQNKIGN
jgi:glycine cleavage system H protein